MLKTYAYASGLIKSHGVRGLSVKVLERRRDSIERDYVKNWKKYMVTQEEWNIQRNTMFERMPLVSVVVPTYETPEPYLKALLDSMQGQSYQNWELCIADGSEGNKVEEIVCRYSRTDERIRYQHLSANLGIAENTNAALKMAIGEWIGLLDHDDFLAPNALYEVVRMMNARPDCEVIYSDEDKVDEHGEHHMRPHFKLDYNKELLLHYNYICHFLVMKASLLHRIGYLNEDYDGAQDYDLVLRLAEVTERFEHIRKVLYHWRVHRGSTAGSAMAKNYAQDAGKRALEAHFKRQHIPAWVKPVAGQNYYEVIYKADEAPLGEIDTKEIYTAEELDVQIRSMEADYILLYNSQVAGRITSEEKKRLLQQCMQRKIGMTGVRFQKKNKLVSCGIEAKSGGDYAFMHAGLPAVFQGYFHRAVIPQNVRAVPLDLCIIRKEAYLQTDGIPLDTGAVAAAVCFADRLREKGYEVVLDAGITAKYKG